uniref:Ground-like domain-containing protein n=1 Tax=Brugia pahangi TaxID=6280 RepID=A0A0N4TEL1_BRUPA
LKKTKQNKKKTKQNNELNVLAEHWAISGECGVNQARDLTYRDDERCQEYFQNSDSPLRLCFNHVTFSFFFFVSIKKILQQIFFSFFVSSFL